MKKDTRSAVETNPIANVEKEVDSIKRLLVLLLIKMGATQEEVGAAIGLDRSCISRMFEGIKIAKIDKLK